MYIIAIFLETEGTYGLRQLLFRNGFQIYIRNKLSGEISTAPGDYESEREIINYFSKDLYEFECVFNSLTDFPSQDVFRAISEARHKMRSMNIEYRRFAK